jgi:hypothetical protein
MFCCIYVCGPHNIIAENKADDGTRLLLNSFPVECHKNSYVLLCHDDLHKLVLFFNQNHIFTIVHYRSETFCSYW